MSESRWQAEKLAYKIICARTKSPSPLIFFILIILIVPNSTSIMRKLLVLYYCCQCTSLLENVSLRQVPDFSTFSVCPSNKHCPARCAYAANVVGKDLDIFAVGAVSLYHILKSCTQIVNNI
jgi:hypothetical protein